jgi:TonB family protein
MLETKEMEADALRAFGRPLADPERPMTGLKLILSRMNGWALSLLLHGGVALLAGLSVVSVQMGGGNGDGSGGASGSGAIGKSYEATLHSGDEQTISGTIDPDVAQYSRLEDSALESVAEDLPTPTIPFDVFAVGATEPIPAQVSPSLADPLFSRPGSAESRTEKLPAASQEGSPDGDGAQGSAGSSGSGSGSDDGKGNGEGTGEGNAVGIYTPAPAYPSEARRRNIEGSVLVEFAISSDGSCAVRQILESSGFTPLDDAVQSTILHWKYRPASADGRPDVTMKRLRFTFRLSR